MQPVFDLHGPLVEDEHRTCRDDKQDRDKLQTKFENMKYKDSLQNTKYNIQNTKYVPHNAKFKYKNASVDDLPILTPHQIIRNQDGWEVNEVRLPYLYNNSKYIMKF